MRMSYSGKVRIEEASEAALRAVLEADLREQRGQGTAKARMTMLVSEAGGGSQVATVTAVKLSGRAAQMAQGVIDDVADRLVGEMASCLAARFEPAGEGKEPAGSPRSEADQRRAADAAGALDEDQTCLRRKERRRR